MRAPLEESFYNVNVTPSEMWQAVGKVLERARLDRKWRPIQVERAGGPSYKTVQAIEAGDAGNVDMLEKYARALDLSIVDILDSVLTSRVTPLTPEAAHVVRKFYGDNRRRPERDAGRVECTTACRCDDGDTSDTGRRGSATSIASTAAWPSGSKASYWSITQRSLSRTTVGRADEAAM